jgi:hypothetical protein
VLHRGLVVLPSNHLTVAVSGGIMSRPSKRPRLLQPRKISELTVDTDSDEVGVSSDISSDEGDVSSFEGGSESVPKLSQPQPYHQTASCHRSSSSISSSASDEEDAGESGLGEQIQQPVTLQWTRPSCPQSSVAHIYKGPQGKEGQ